jgi:hypothetical protein
MRMAECYELVEKTDGRYYCTIQGECGFKRYTPAALKQGRPLCGLAEIVHEEQKIIEKDMRGRQQRRA